MVLAVSLLGCQLTGHYASTKQGNSATLIVGPTSDESPSAGDLVVGVDYIDQLVAPTALLWGGLPSTPRDVYLPPGTHAIAIYMVTSADMSYGKSQGRNTNSVNESVNCNLEPNETYHFLGTYGRDGFTLKLLGKSKGSQDWASVQEWHFQSPGVFERY